ncbi:hypothetical protein [Roseomonas sp. BN140053]|uniref:hypothetical protein n=1 Tax=Roseomonas sp. BN140053 TaxID=3391898 RepID=UPI0039E97A51
MSSEAMTAGTRASPTVILITGAVREPLEFYATLDRALLLVRQGRATHVVISTWKGQLDSFEGLWPLLRDSRVHVVEATPPDTLGHGAAHAQFKSTISGLLACPAGSRVLRCRTDKTLKVMGGLEPILDHDLPASEMVGQYASPFRSKVVILGYSSTAFLWMSDFCFLGVRDDLLCGLGMARQFDDIFFNPTISPELRVLSWPFYQGNVFLTELFHGLSHYALSHAFVGWSARPDADLPRPMARLLALHAAAHTGSFVCARDFGRMPEPTIPLLSLMTGQPQRHLMDMVYIAGLRGTRTSSSRLFADLAAQGLASRSGSSAFDTAMAELHAGLASSWRLDQAEADELLRFVTDAMNADKPMMSVIGGQELTPFIGRARNVAVPARPPAEEAITPIVAEYLKGVLRNLGISGNDEQFVAISAEIMRRPGLIMAALESTILFWCAVHSLLRTENASPRAAWQLLAAATKGRSSDAQIFRGWLWRLPHSGAFLPEEAETAYNETLRDVSDAARKNFWPALVLAAMFRLDGAARHFDPAAALSQLRQAIRTAGPFAPALIEAVAFLERHPPVGPVTLLFWREQFSSATTFLDALGATHRMPEHVRTDIQPARVPA